MISRSLPQTPTNQLLQTTENTEDRYISEIIPHIALPEGTFICVEPASISANVFQRKGCFINDCFNMKLVCDPSSQASESHSPDDCPHHRTQSNCGAVLPLCLPSAHHSFNKKGSKWPTHRSQNESLWTPSREEGRCICTPLGRGRHDVSHWCLIAMSPPGSLLWVQTVSWKVKQLKPQEKQSNCSIPSPSSTPWAAQTAAAKSDPLPL